jgi:hypothetical protein
MTATSQRHCKITHITRVCECLSERARAFKPWQAMTGAHRLSQAVTASVTACDSL